MSKEVKILGIETSCDETSAAVVVDGRQVLANVVSSQAELHKKFGGVVPEIASRRHLELINPVIKESLILAGTDLSQITAIAVTIGPGLVGALLIGLASAKALKYVLNVPLLGVNHLEAHIYANFIEYPDLSPPLICLVVSGGHTVLVFIDDDFSIEVLGQTLDDAAGEAFDKISRFLDLGYPGGPAIDSLAKEGDSEAIQFPRAMIDRKSYDFSLSGLKTAVINYVTESNENGVTINVPDVAASFQAAIVDVQVDKLLRAAREKQCNTILLAGGVASNSSLRINLAQQAAKTCIKVLYPSTALCTDNAAMIAGLAYKHYQDGKTLGLDANVDARLAIGSSL